MPAIETLRTEFTADLSPLLQAVRQGSDVLRQFASLAAGSARAVAVSFSGVGPAAGLAQGLLGAARDMAAPVQMFSPSAAGSRPATAGESAGASTTYRAGDVINTFNIQALSEAAVRSQLLPLIEQAYRRGQARPPWINR